jgi:predicted ArsR family transcriptional regulator
MPAQLDLLDQLAAQPAPHCGALESRIAALSLSRERRSRDHRRILDLLRGTPGLTDEEIQAALGLPGNTERPRRRELESAGLLRRERGGLTASGRPAARWYLREVVPA